MFERWVAPLLMRLLGDYVKEETFDLDRLHLSVWSGEFSRGGLRPAELTTPRRQPQRRDLG
jgi:hypothetical protein